MWFYIIGIIVNLILWTCAIMYGRETDLITEEQFSKAVILSAAISFLSWLSIVLIIVYYFFFYKDDE